MRIASLVLVLAACSHDGTRAGVDAAADATAIDAPPDASNACRSTSAGAAGTCVTTTACGALANHVAVAGDCATAAPITCCIATPSVADNPPIPTGWKYMTNAQVTPAMTTWAVSILHDPVAYPMFSTTMMTFGTQLVLARVEWHPPDFQNGVVHRGVSLFVPV